MVQGVGVKVNVGRAEGWVVLLFGTLQELMKAPKDRRKSAKKDKHAVFFIPSPFGLSMIIHYITMGFQFKKRRR
jgi:hypothetical protein